MTEAEGDWAAVIAWFRSLTFEQAADMRRRQPDGYYPLERLARGAKFVLTYAD